jgi:hypothetical protein
MTYCKPCHNKRTRESVEANGGARNYHLRRRYGITAEHADELLAEQNGRCAIRREAPADHVDHDHATGRVRGLLCFNCNGALGQFRDRTDLMLRAVGYLRGGAWAALVQESMARVGFHVVPDEEPPPDEGRRSA